MNPFEEIKGEVAEYFRDLGYQVTWDFKQSAFERWYEIMDGGKLAVQIDMGIPLADIIEDFLCFYQGKEGTSKSDYKISVDLNDQTAFKELLRRVAVANNKFTKL
jgi:hypothetical protein